MSHSRYNNSDPDFPSAGDGTETHVFRCNWAECKEEIEEEGDFHSVWEETKRNGWKAFKGIFETNWRHYCPKHAKEVKR